MKITRERLKQIIKEEFVRESADPVGPEEAQKVAELLQNLGFTLTRGGLNSLIDFMQGLEQSGDLNATPDSRRGALAEAEEVPYEQLAQQVLDSWTQAFGKPEKVTKMGSHWSWWVPVEEAEARGLNPATTNAPPAVRYPEWQFDRSSGRYRSKANPRVSYKSAVQGAGTPEVRLVFDVAMGN